MKKSAGLKCLAAAFVIGLPVVAAAAPAPGTLGDLLNNLKEDLINPLVGILLTLAILAFFFGLVKYIWSVGQGKEEGKSIMVWGVVAIFVMVSVWGIVNLLQLTFFNSDDESSYSVPMPSDFLPSN